MHSIRGYEDTFRSIRARLTRDRELLTTAALGFSASAFIATHGYRGDQLGIAWILLAVAFAFSRRSIKDPYVLAGMTFILVSAYVAIPMSLTSFGTGFWIESLTMAVWMTPFILIYFIDVNQKVFYWILPFASIHVLVLIYEGLQTTERVRGLVDNAVPAGGILALLSIYLMTTRFRWLVPFMLAGILFTGSRGSVLLLLVVAFAVAIQRCLYTKLSWCSAGSLVFLAVFVISTYQYIPERLKLDSLSTSSVSEKLELGKEDYGNRIVETQESKWFPLGYSYSTGLHILPKRIAVELGRGAALAWLGITFYSLIRRPRFTGAWWVLLSTGLVSFSEYYTFLGPIAILWWLTVSIRMKEVKDGSQQEFDNSIRA